MRAVLLAVITVCCMSASAAPAGSPDAQVPGLRTIAGWLQSKGTPGYVGADVADAMGIRRAQGDKVLDAMQRGFRDERGLRMAQVIDGETLLFMVQAEGEIYFYLSSVRGGLRKALLSLPTRESVITIDGAEAQASFLREVRYWEDKAAAR
jgi:hypothetical protein